MGPAMARHATPIGTFAATTACKFIRAPAATPNPPVILYQLCERANAAAYRPVTRYAQSLTAQITATHEPT